MKNPPSPMAHNPNRHSTTIGGFDSPWKNNENNYKRNSLGSITTTRRWALTRRKSTCSNNRKIQRFKGRIASSYKKYKKYRRGQSPTASANELLHNNPNKKLISKNVHSQNNLDSSINRHRERTIARSNTSIAPISQITEHPETIGKSSSREV